MAAHTAERLALQDDADEWRSLLDVNYCDHCCERLQTHVVEAEKRSEHIAVADLIERRLLNPLGQLQDTYFSDTGGRPNTSTDAAWRLQDRFERLAEHLREWHCPLDEDDREWLRERLAAVRDAWVMLIAVDGSASALRQQMRAIASRAAAKKPRARITAKAVAAYWHQHPNQKYEVSIAELARAHSVSDRTVARRYREAKENGLVS